MISITRGGDVRRVRPRFHAEVSTSLHTMTAVFGTPDLIASSLWIARVEMHAGRAKQVLICPDVAKSGFDPASQPDRAAWWVIVSESDAIGDGHAFAPVITAIRAAAGLPGLAAGPTARPKAPGPASVGAAAALTILVAGDDEMTRWLRSALGTSTEGQPGDDDGHASRDDG